MKTTIIEFDMPPAMVKRLRALEESHGVDLLDVVYRGLAEIDKDEVEPVPPKKESRERS